METLKYDNQFLLKRLGTKIVEHLVKMIRKETIDYSEEIYQSMLTEEHRATPSVDGFMSSTDKSKLDNAEVLTSVNSISSITNTIDAEENEYYKLGFNVSNLTINLPEVSGSDIKLITFYFSTGVNPAVTFSSSSVIEYQENYEIRSNQTYEISCLWNGSEWVITRVVINS